MNTLKLQLTLKSKEINIFNYFSYIIPYFTYKECTFSTLPNVFLHLLELVEFVMERNERRISGEDNGNLNQEDGSKEISVESPNGTVEKNIWLMMIMMVR